MSAVALLVAAVLWSLVAFGLFHLLADGGALLVALTRWLELDPAATQWFADSLSEAGSPGAGLALTIWGAGLVVLVALFALTSGRNRS